jgi:hypothetical protein
VLLLITVQLKGIPRLLPEGLVRRTLTVRLGLSMKGQPLAIVAIGLIHCSYALTGINYFEQIFFETMFVCDSSTLSVALLTVFADWSPWTQCPVHCGDIFTTQGI